MAPNEQDRQRRDQVVADFLRTTCASLKCPACGQSRWHNRPLSALVGLANPYHPLSGVGNVVSELPTSARPEEMVLPVECACGYLMLFAAQAIGAEPRAS
jgi:hypothetical protein